MITSLSEQVGLVHRRGQAKDFEIAYRKMNQFVDKINDKILNRLQLYQQVYFEDYKEQVEVMTAQLRTLKENLDSQVLYNKSNEKMFLLEQERDFFRAQVLKLNAEVNNLMDQNKKLKNKVFDLEDQVKNYKAITFNFEKKIQKLQLQRTQTANFKREISSAMEKGSRKYDQGSSRQMYEHQTIEPRTEGCNSRITSMERKPTAIVRTRTYSKVESATKASMRRYQQVNDRDHIIDQCIKQTKKQIFYRSSEQKNPVIPFDELAKITFDKFTRTDKKTVISKLLNNQKLVEEFAQFLAARSSADTTSRMVRTKIGDEKFNQKFLVDLKRSFNKKIFDVKTNNLHKAKRDIETQ